MDNLLKDHRCPILAGLLQARVGLRLWPMPTELERFYGKHDLHFLTFSCYRRLPLLGTMRARDLFVRELGKVRAAHGFLLIGYVVMPEHVHLLISEPKKGTPSTVLQVLKQCVPRKMRKRKRKSPGGAAIDVGIWRNSILRSSVR